jgi:phosphotransferase system IIB component
MEKVIEWKIIKESPEWKCNSLGNVMRIKTGRIMKPCIDTKGYKQVVLRRKHHLVHRLIAIYFIENPKNLQCVDHFDGCPLNNDITNLRWCTTQQNSMNRKMNKNNTSGYAGVVFSNNKYNAVIRVNKTIHIGRYSTAIEAHNARTKYIIDNNLTYFRI